MDTRKRNTGAYITNTLALTRALHVTLSGRYYQARIVIADQSGVEPTLNGARRSIAPSCETTSSSSIHRSPLIPSSSRTPAARAARGLELGGEYRGGTFDAIATMPEQFRSSGAPRSAWVGIEYRIDPPAKSR